MEEILANIIYIHIIVPQVESNTFKHSNSLALVSHFIIHHLAEPSTLERRQIIEALSHRIDVSELSLHVDVIKESFRAGQE